MFCILPSFHTTTNCLIIATCSISMYLYVSSLQSFILVAVLYIWDHIFLHTIYHSNFVHKTSAWLVHSLHLKIIFTLYLCYISMQIHNISSLTDNHTFLWTHFSCPASKSPTYFSLQSLGGVFAHHTSELQVSHRESFLCNFSWLIFSHTNSKIWGCYLLYIERCVSRARQ